jgi:putative MATE family efflux protein
MVLINPESIKIDMTTPSRREIWKISAPIMVSLLAQNIVGVTDTAFLGRVGEVELGASAIGGVFYLILYMVSFGFTTGVQILIARRHGEKSHASIGPIFDNSFYFIGLFSLLITAAVLFFGSSFLRIILSSDSIFQASSEYLSYRVLGLFFATSALLFRSFYTGISFTKYLTAAAIVMALSNVLLDYLMIFGHWGFPAMGIKGAGLASSISEVIALLFFVWITVGNHRLKHFFLFKLVRPDLTIIKKTLGISVFVMIQFVLSFGSWFVFFMIVEKMGERPLAVSNIIRSIYIFMMIPGWALCTVTSSLVSSAMGEGKPDRVMPIIIKLLKISFLSILVLVLVAALFPTAIISVYTNNPSLIQATIPSFYIILGALIIFSFMSILFNGVLGTANTRIAMVIEAVTLSAYLGFTWLVAVYLKYEIEWVWVSEYVYFFLIGALSFWYLKKGAWREKVI